MEGMQEKQEENGLVYLNGRFLDCNWCIMGMNLSRFGKSLGTERTAYHKTIKGVGITSQCYLR